MCVIECVERSFFEINGEIALCAEPIHLLSLSPSLTHSHTHSLTLLGILLMELVEGEPPYMDTAPIRALFFITTRGIPDLKQPGRW